MKGINIDLNEGTHAPGVIAKIQCRHFNISFSRTTRSILTKLDTMHPRVMRIQIKIHTLLQGEITATLTIITFAPAGLLLRNISHVGSVAHGPLI